MGTDLLVVLCTCPPGEAASRLAERLVDSGCAACVNLLGPARSLYRWEGRLEQAEETLLIIKTVRDRYPELETLLRESHPYQVPEILALPVTAGLAEYMKWVRDSTCEES